MADEQTQATSRQQLSFTWKSGYRDVFQQQLDAWAETQPQGKRSAQDYIIWMTQHIDQQEANTAIRERLEVMGMNGFYEAWKARRAADDRLLEVATDRMIQAKAEAESEVQADIAALQKSNGILEKTLEKANADLEALRTELVAVKADCEQVTAEKTEIEREKGELSEAVKGMKINLDSAIADSEKAKNELEQEKLSTIGLKEKAVKQESELNALQKRIDETELVRKQEQGEMSAKLKELQAERDQLAARLDQEQKHGQEAEAMSKELAEAKIKIAGMEATIEEQKNNIANLRGAMELLQTIKTSADKMFSEITAARKGGKAGGASKAQSVKQSLEEPAQEAAEK